MNDYYVWIVDRFAQGCAPIAGARQMPCATFAQGALFLASGMDSSKPAPLEPFFVAQHRPGLNSWRNRITWAFAVAKFMRFARQYKTRPFNV